VKHCLFYANMPSPSSTVGPAFILAVLQEASLYQRFLSHLSPVSVLCLRQTCSIAHKVVNNFTNLAFDINKHFEAFLVNPIEFRSLQARTGTVVSGSNALQFFDRTCYEGSDMDAYVHPGHALEVGLWLIKKEEYTFIPHYSQSNLTFEALIAKDDVNFTSPRSYKEHRGPANPCNYFNEYRFTGVDGVYNFVRIVKGNYKRIQVMLTKYNPLDVILHFHSSKSFSFHC